MLVVGFITLNLTKKGRFVYPLSSLPYLTLAGFAAYMTDPRSAGKQAAFFLPHLRSGMKLLDCGSGPGSITVGLAKVVAPGQTVGIDSDSFQVECARIYAHEQGVDTIRFESGSVYQLPFADDLL